jgi:hypothetical protein
MGSIVSFPVLCIANAAICRWTLELQDQRIYMLRDCKLAINGDDAVFPCNDFGRSTWEKIGTFCGLEPSIGKVYYSNSFLNINSTTYNYHKDGYESVFLDSLKSRMSRTRLIYFELVKYVNLGLLFNMQRSGGPSDGLDTRELSISARCRELIKHSPYQLQERVMGQFLMLNDKQLKRFGLPWFIPEQLGGLGLTSVGKYGNKSIDLKLAKMIYDDPQRYPIDSVPVKANWQTWKYAIKRFGAHLPPMYINDFGMSDSPNHRVYSWNKLLSLACIEALFRVKNLKELYLKNPKTFTVASNTLRRNSNTYKRALFDTKGQLAGLPKFDPRYFPKVLHMDDVPMLLQRQH